MQVVQVRKRVRNSLLCSRAPICPLRRPATISCIYSLRCTATWWPGCVIYYRAGRAIKSFWVGYHVRKVKVTEYQEALICYPSLLVNPIIDLFAAEITNWNAPLVSTRIETIRHIHAMQVGTTGNPHGQLLGPIQRRKKNADKHGNNGDDGQKLYQGKTTRFAICNLQFVISN